MVNAWMTALKEWNRRKGGPWCIPRKGTSDYNAVRALMKPIAVRSRDGFTITRPEAKMKGEGRAEISAWHRALTIWNRRHNKTGKWCVPKKGQPAYYEVMAIYEDELD
jgi:hypothetical protein